MTPLLHTRSPAARILGVTPRRISQLIAEGALEFVVIGRQKFIPADSLNELVEKRRQRAAIQPDQSRERVRSIAARRNRRLAERPAP